MIHHIVLMKFKESLSEEEVAKIMAEVRHLKVTIPQIVSFTDGVNCSVEGLAKGFTHAFTILFETIADRDAYLVHPDHVHIAKEVLVPNLKDGVEGAIVFDYEA
jgi:biotin-(acetyl-CoA carboxylase) ligase